VADVLAVGAAWLEARRRESLARAVTYCRGADSVELAATVGRSEHEELTADGLVVTHRTRDFLVAAAELILGGEAAAPAAGDRIREDAGGETAVYEVLSVGGRPCWRYEDAHRNTVRVHTKHVATE